ncbi:hypothetical protein BX666DRAFT_2117003 [Dichotomocladium elegans]|nr:hypothetical protein BX666DRAFT_2117003 [Dichotomocladium elegans]
MSNDAIVCPGDLQSSETLGSPSTRSKSPMKTPLRSDCCSPTLTASTSRRPSVPNAPSFSIKRFISYQEKKKKQQQQEQQQQQQQPPPQKAQKAQLFTLLADNDEQLDTPLPPLPHSPSEILSQQKDQDGPRYYAYSPSQLVRRDRYYETITTTTGDHIFLNREAMDRQNDAENEAFWLEVPVGQLDQIKRQRRRHPLSMCTTASQWEEVSPQRNEGDLIWSRSSPELPDLDELFCDQDDDDEEDDEDDSLGPLAQYARENRRKRRRLEAAASVH